MDLLSSLEGFQGIVIVSSAGNVGDFSRRERAHVPDAAAKL